MKNKDKIKYYLTEYWHDLERKRESVKQLEVNEHTDQWIKDISQSMQDVNNILSDL